MSVSLQVVYFKKHLLIIIFCLFCHPRGVGFKMKPLHFFRRCCKKRLRRQENRMRCIVGNLATCHYCILLNFNLKLVKVASKRKHNVPCGLHTPFGNTCSRDVIYVIKFYVVKCKVLKENGCLIRMCIKRHIKIISTGGDK